MPKRRSTKSFGDLDFIELLLKRGADTNAQMLEGAIPLAMSNDPRLFSRFSGVEYYG
jgi:hypothetical protein